MFQNRLCLRKGTYLASAYLEYYCKKCFASPVRCNPRAALPYQARSQAHTYLPPPPPTKNAGPGQLCVILCLCKAKQSSRRPAAIYTGRDFCSHHKRRHKPASSASSGTLSTQSTEEGWQLHRSPTAPWLPAMLSSRDNRGVSQATKRRKPDGVTTNTGPSVMLVGMLPALPSDSHPSWRADGLGRLQRSVPTQGEGDTGFSQVSVCV